MRRKRDSIRAAFGALRSKRHDSVNREEAAVHQVPTDQLNGNASAPNTNVNIDGPQQPASSASPDLPGTSSHASPDANSSGSHEIGKASIRELWMIAYESLRGTDKGLIQDYEKLIANSIAGLSSLAPGISSRETMELILRQKVDEVEKDRWRLPFFEWSTADCLQTVAKILSSANDHITDALSLHSTATVAWAGVSLLLPLLLNPAEQAASLVEGLGYISHLIVLSRMREELYVRRYESRQHRSEKFNVTHTEYKNALRSLYQEIIKFQATAYCYYAHHSASRLISDIVKRNDWEDLLGKIRARDHEFEKISKAKDDSQYEEDLRAEETRHNELLKTLNVELDRLLDKIEETRDQRENKQLFEWLCQVDHDSIHNTGLGLHQRNTSDWLFQEVGFKTWTDSPGAFLWLHGKAGSGKSILSSSVIRHLQETVKGNPFKAVAFFFFSFSDAKKQDLDTALASLIRQICSCRPVIPAAVQALDSLRSRGGRPDTATLQEALMASVKGFSAVYIVLDALDECPALNGERDRLLQYLTEILKEMPDSLHLLCTSRKELDIDDEIRPHLSSPVLAELDLETHREAVDRDISLYVEATFASTKFKRWPADLKLEAKQLLLERADGMFQYVRCQFDELRKASSLAEMQEALRGLPAGLDATYNRMLQKIDAKRQSQVKRLLQWIAFSTYPITVDQLAEILILYPQRDPPIDETQRLFSSDKVLDYLSGLVVVYDVGQRRVRFSHFSIQEYLTSHRIGASVASAFQLKEVDAHLQIARSCLAYILKVIALTPPIPRNSCEFHDYILHSAGFVKILEVIPRDKWPDDVLRDFRLVFTCNSPSMVHITGNMDELARPYLFTANEGCLKLTETLIRSEKYSGYITQADLDLALQIEATCQRREVCELLLKLGANVNGEAVSQYGRALTAAVSRPASSAQFADFLLDHGADVNAADEKRGSALQQAARYSSLSIVKCLVHRGANIHERNRFGCALTAAAGSGNREIVEFLLDNGADINMQGTERQGTALYNAPTRTRFVGKVVNLLLTRGADVHEAGGPHGYPLHSMCFSFYRRDIIIALLEHGADINAQSKTIGTALQMLCSHSQRSVPLNSPDVYLLAAEMLIDKGADVNAQGGFFGTALQAASARWPGEVQDLLVDLLLRNKADPNIPGGQYGTALHAACLHSRPKVVGRLLDHGADVNARDSQGMSVLQAACAHRDLKASLQLVELLLERGVEKPPTLDPDAKCFELSSAPEDMIFGISPEAKRLVAELRPGSMNHWSLEKRDFEMTRNGPQSPQRNRSDIYSERQLGEGADVNAPNHSHGTALNTVLKAELKFSPRFPDEVTKSMNLALLARGADVNVVSEEHGFPLQTACLSREDQGLMTKWLLETCPSADVNVQGGKVGSALQAAAASGQMLSIKLLLERGALVNARGGKYGTALNAAVMAGWWNIVDILLENGAEPDCFRLKEPDKVWLAKMREEDGRSAVERYLKFWEVQMARRREA